ncbi:MAG: hypothetical protein ACXVR1_08625 [Solirubrobacteraceae bacterium]
MAEDDSRHFDGQDHERQDDDDNTAILEDRVLHQLGRQPRAERQDREHHCR